MNREIKVPEFIKVLLAGGTPAIINTRNIVLVKRKDDSDNLYLVNFTDGKYAILASDQAEILCQQLGFPEVVTK